MRDGGFTLLEMLVVLTILGLLGGIVVARGPQRSAALELRLSADGVAQTMRSARARAMAEGRPVRVAFDRAAGAIVTDTVIARRLPRGIVAAVTPGAIVFMPDGSSGGGEVALSAASLRTVLKIDWLTGQTIVSGTVQPVS